MLSIVWMYNSWRKPLENNDLSKLLQRFLLYLYHYSKLIVFGKKNEAYFLFKNVLNRFCFKNSVSMWTKMRICFSPYLLIITLCSWNSNNNSNSFLKILCRLFFHKSIPEIVLKKTKKKNVFWEFYPHSLHIVLEHEYFKTTGRILWTNIKKKNIKENKSVSNYSKV